MAEKNNEIMNIPISIIWEGILFCPIWGILDSQRTQLIMDAVLDKIESTQSKVLIIDIIGVVTVDSAVANHLIKITKATKLMGCESVISGISPSVAQTIVNLGIDLSGIITKSTIKEALDFAFKKLNLKIISDQK
ncbi:STAS domain-containing protein [Rosettibacter firmus]|uniref:STAS domain-containing protein n=1 Tax=Rosettibacter firmus TaxID=3111522 RepID=UPI00336BBF1F